MIAFAWILLLAASSRVELVNQDYRIAAADWQWVPVGLKQQPGMISAHFEVQSASGPVRLVLMPRAALEDMPHGSLAQTPTARSGYLVHYIEEEGDYALVVDNRQGTTPADVHLSVWIDFTQLRTHVETLPPRRQLTVVLLSFAAFFGIVTWSARRLLRAVRR
jgi:hypothetical protein